MRAPDARSKVSRSIPGVAIEELDRHALRLAQQADAHASIESLAFEAETIQVSRPVDQIPVKSQTSKNSGLKPVYLQSPIIRRKQRHTNKIRFTPESGLCH